ncbi:pyridoxal phosphate-dependent aminotransferase [Sphingobium sp. B12D2B]|uniref:pyridoxal phosphate-dependent aminotransferase n=1 Tax=Sphingobium sp. B12D2B TaxID=2940577 RepID=UPI0022255B7F|nr:histidinol-phosphate transaminase [Sphingobium sp. B12D2B]MCW2351582.1 histidinol-phosphate aminotransferase [Sphingobium sp. B12D2B]
MMQDKKRAPARAPGLVQGGAVNVPFLQTDRDAPVASLFGPLPGQARLVGNENPFGPAPSALKALAETAGSGCYYADRGVFHLTSMIAERHGVTPAQVVLGAGSTEILCATALAWGQKGSIICPSLFWDAPILFAERKGVACIYVPLAADMNFDLEAMAGHLSEDVSLVHLVNPNNPTGMALDNAALRAFARTVSQNGTTLLVDEAYNELSDRPEESSLVDLVRAGEDVIVTRTFSKIYGMAGLRVGYALTSEENAARIRSYMTSFGGNVAGISAAIACYNDEAFLAASLASIREGREMILDAVARAGLTALPSQTNFVFVKVPDADALDRAMRERNIVIRGAFGEWAQYSRVSVGHLHDVSRYAEALPNIIELMV